ncbi:MAG: D-alanine--D-alanine ligase family protein, partial [Rhizomicrobium sp.]
MRVLVLHSDVPPDAPPDEQDTLVTASAVAAALAERGHDVVQRAFMPSPAALASALAESDAELVFNLVESVFGQGDLAGIAAAMLERRGIPYTGASAAALGCAASKPLTKRVLRAAGVATPDWAEPPGWDGLADDRTYVVKSANEDASLGLDDGAVVTGRRTVLARVAACVSRHGGVWFAETYCPGREFNLSVIEEDGGPRILPIAEIRFDHWRQERPRLVGYAAKWESDSPDCVATPRVFGIEEEAPILARELGRLAVSAWQLLGLRGYARVDFRLDAAGAPMMLEINPNPCLEPSAGFAAAARKAEIAYVELV